MLAEQKKKTLKNPNKQIQKYKSISTNLMELDMLINQTRIYFRRRWWIKRDHPAMSNFKNNRLHFLLHQTKLSKFTGPNHSRQKIFRNFIECRTNSGTDKQNSKGSMAYLSRLMRSNYMQNIGTNATNKQIYCKHKLLHNE